MEAVHDGTGGPSALKYEQLIWGDVATGTKAQIQALGIGQGLAFPGEPGGPKKALDTVDPRGFEVNVFKRCTGPDLFAACIRFPGRASYPPGPKPTPFAPGVMRLQSTWRDTYFGTPEALEAAGIALASQMPGQPGMRKTRVQILPGGELPQGAIHARRHPDANLPGAKVIQRKGKGTFQVHVVLAKDERLRRETARHAEEAAWDARMWAMPRPSPLWPPGAGCPGAKQVAARAASGHLRLVWDHRTAGAEVGHG